MGIGKRPLPLRTTHFLLATRSTFYSLLSWATTLLAVWVDCLTLMTLTHPKGSMRGNRLKIAGLSPKRIPGHFSPLKTWIFAIFSLVEFLAKMAYGRGGNYASHSKMLSPTLLGRVCICYRLMYKLREPEIGYLINGRGASK